jgi:hypothetical protein
VAEVCAELRIGHAGAMGDIGGRKAAAGGSVARHEAVEDRTAAL